MIYTIVTDNPNALAEYFSQSGAADDVQVSPFSHAGAVLDALMTALPKMLYAYKSGVKQVVHCDFGNNRSRSFVEALYYCLYNEHFQDEYKGEINHLAYNCTIKHLPQLNETEEVLRKIGSI